jgi:hypothetical protein
MSEHRLEMAKALVKIKDGKIVVLTDPLLSHCPLMSDLYGCKEESQRQWNEFSKDILKSLECTIPTGR